MANELCNNSVGVSKLDRRISVAPMMDWTDRHCRYFHRLLAPHARLYTEMVTTGAVLHGESLYRLRAGALPFTYPPFAAVVLTVLAVIPRDAAVALLTAASEYDSVSASDARGVRMRGSDQQSGDLFSYVDIRRRSIFLRRW